MPTDYITLSQAAQELPGQPHLVTLHRWATRGIKGVKLGTIRVGGRRLTTKEDIDLFLSRLNETDEERLVKAGC